MFGGSIILFLQFVSRMCEATNKQKQIPNMSSTTTEPNQTTDEKTKLANLMEKLTVQAIETPIEVLKERISDMPREDVVAKLNAMYSEMVKLQYRLREYATVEWYDTLDDRRKGLHNLFEKNREFFKGGSEGKNWLFISDVKPKHLSTEVFTDDGPDYYFTFFADTDAMNKTLDKMRTREVNKCLCTPLFKVDQ